MNLKNLLSKVSVLLVILTFLVGTALQAQTVYVSATNGDDTFGTGTQANPYRTIQHAIDVAATGSTISIEAGVYNSTVLPGEGNPISLTTNRSFTFVGTAVGANTTVLLTNGFTLNNSSAVVTWGSSGTASFNFGSTNTALVLTAGTMNITPANVALGSGATLEITDGALNGVPTTGSNLNVTFDGTNSISSTVGFLPSSLGSGTLTINKASGDITIDNASLSVGNLVSQNAANATLSGNLTVANNGDITNSSTGTLTLGASAANLLTMSSTANPGGIITVSGGGSVVVNSAVAYNVKNAGTSSTAGDSPQLTVGNIVAVSGNSNFTANGNITFNNTNVASNNGKNAVDNNVTISNAGTGSVAINGSILTPLSGVTFSAPTGGNDNAYIDVILANTSTGKFSTRSAALRGATGTNGVVNNAGGTMTLGQTGDTFTTGYDVVNDNANSNLTVAAAATFSGAFSNNNTDASGTEMVTFNSNASISGLLTNAANMKINSNTLTLSNGTTSSGAAVAALNNTGDIYSSASSSVGTGIITLTGRAAEITGGGKLPNIIFNSSNSTAPAYPAISNSATIYGYLNLTGSGTLYINGATDVKGDVNMTAGSLTLGADLTVEGTFNMPQGTFSFGANTLHLVGNFIRTGGTIDVAAAGTGTLDFAGSHNQTFTPGTQMNVYNVTVNNNGNYLANVITDDQVQINGSLLVLNNFTITKGQVVLGTSNIRMEEAAAATFTNGGRGYTSTGVGGLIFEGAGAASVLSGSQPYSNIYVRLTNALNNVSCTGAVKISGVVTLDAGGISWAAGQSLTLDNSLVIPTVVINTQNTHGSPFLVNGLGAPALAISTVYNLSYTGQTSTTISDKDFISGSVNDLSILAGTTAKTITLNAANGTIKGNLWVDKGETFNLNSQTLTASGNTATHTVNGTVTNGTLDITGTGATLTSTDSKGAATVANLTVNPSSGGTFNSTNMQVISNLVINQSGLVSTITFNSATATVATFTNTAGTTNLNMNSTASTITGNVSIVAGNVTLTMNDGAAATSTIGGTLTISGGTLNLGSDIYVTGAVTQSGSGSFVLGDKNLTLAGAYTHSNSGTISAGAGYLVSTPANSATVNYTLTSTVTIPNWQIKGGNSTSQVALATKGISVSNAFRLTSGELNLAALPLTITGNTIRYDGGSIAANAATGLVSLQGSAAMFTAYANVTIPYLEVNSSDTVTFATNDNTTPTPRNFYVTNAFTHTKGLLDLGINDLVLTDDGAGHDASFTTAATADSVIGSTGSNPGEVVFNGANNNGTLTLADNYFIQNLKTTSSVTKTDTKVLTVGSNFYLNGGNFTFANSSYLVLGNHATITRSGGVFDKAPTFGDTVNVDYEGNVSTDVELPTSTTALDNLTVNGNVTFTANATVNGTLYLKGGVVDLTTKGKVLTVATGATINRSGGAFGANNDDFPTVTTYNLVYSGAAAINAIGPEFSSSATAVTSLTVAMSGNGVYLSKDRTVGSFTMSPTGNTPGNVYFALGADNDPHTLTVTGATTINNGVVSTMDNVANNTTAGTLLAEGNVLVNGGSLGKLGTDDGAGVDGGLNLTFGGTTAQMLKLNGNTTLPSLTLNSKGTVDTTEVVKVSGGDLTVSNLLIFVNGILNMGNNMLILPNPNAAGNSGLGYDRSGVTGNNVGCVAGFISRHANVNDGSFNNGRFEFPTGDTTGQYRPVAITFTPSYPVGNPVNIIVKNVDTAAGGNVGLPLDGGNGVKIGGYPNFYWLIKTSPSSFTSTQNFDIELTAHNIGYPYNSYQDLRMIRRNDGNSQQNNWLMQGFAPNYSNVQIVNGTDTTVTVRTTSSIGGLIAAGSRFTMGLPARAPIFTAPAVKVDTVAEGTKDTVQVTAQSQDISATITGYSVSGAKFATINNSGLLVLAPNYGDGAGSPYKVVVNATCSNGLSSNDTLMVVVKVVDRPPVFSKVLPDTTIKSDSAFTFAYMATDPDTGQTLTYAIDSVMPAPTTAPSITSGGVFTWTPSFNDINKAFMVYVSVSDGTLKDSTQAKVTIKFGGRQGAVAPGSTGPDPASASLVLRYVSGDTLTNWTTLTPEQLYAANVDGVAGISSFDAANILYAYAHHDTTLVGTVLQKKSARGTIAFGKLSSEPNTNTVMLPISLTNSANVYSAYIQLNISKDYADIQNVGAELPHGWVMNHSYSKGVLRIAMAGITPLTDGNIAEVSLNLKDKDTHFQVNGSVVLNANLSTNLNNITVKQIPNKFALSQNYPNPFNPSTTIKYQLAQNEKVTLEIYDILGQRVKTLVNEVQDAGYYKIIWDGSNNFGQKVSSGIYIYRLQAGSFVKTLKMNLLK